MHTGGWPAPIHTHAAYVVGGCVCFVVFVPTVSSVRRMLGHWEAASNDLRRACRIDFDPDTEELRVLCDHRTAKIQARQAKRRRAQLVSRGRLCTCAFAASSHARLGCARPSQGQERRQARRTSTGNVVEPQSPHTAASLPAIDASVAAAMGIPPELVGMLLADPDVAAGFQVRACVLRGTWYGCGNSPLSLAVFSSVFAQKPSVTSSLVKVWERADLRVH